MRFIHTADWHLGRIFHGVHLTEDQAHVLDQFVNLAREAKPDCILISGDIYDRAIPPPEAVNLLDDVLTRLVGDLKLRVIISSGNHDSPDRLGFASRLLEDKGLQIAGSLNAVPVSRVIEDEHGPMQISILPYAEPTVVRERTGEEQIDDHNSAMKALVNRIPRDNPGETRHILMAHAFVAGGQISESERPLSIGGAGTVEAAIFQKFHYVALGHLHRPQQVGDESIQYSGSLMKYSFAEAIHKKSINLVEMDAFGQCNVEKVSLPPRRDLRCIEGYFKEILSGSLDEGSREDYLMVTLLDTGAILDAMGQLREVYPNVLHIERPAQLIGGELRGASMDHRQMQDLDLFSAFFSQVTPDELTAEQSDAYAKAVDALRREEREVKS